MMKPFNNHFLNLELNITFNEMQQEVYEYLKDVNVDLDDMQLLMMGDGVNEKE